MMLYPYSSETLKFKYWISTIQNLEAMEQYVYRLTLFFTKYS